MLVFLFFSRKRLTWVLNGLYTVYKDIYSNHTWIDEGDLHHEFESMETGLVDDEK